MTAEFTIRLAQKNEALEITRLHVKVWRETYANIAPEPAIDKLDEKHRLPAWTKHLQSPKVHQKTYVAARDGQIVGFINFGAPTNAVFGHYGEVKHLYVDQSCAGMGIGKHLMHKAFICLKQSGFNGAALAVVRQNSAAKGFYQSIGGIQTGSFTDTGPLWKSENIIVSWPF